MRDLVQPEIVALRAAVVCVPASPERATEVPDCLPSPTTVAGRGY